MITLDTISEFEIIALLDIEQAGSNGLEMNSGKIKNSKKAKLFNAASKLADANFATRKHRFGCTVFTITDIGKTFAWAIHESGKSVIRASEAQTIRQRTRQGGKYSAVNGYCDHCERPKAVTYYHDETDTEICEKCLKKYRAEHNND